DDAATRDEVQMMTVHASKGLEFDNVYLTGLEENLFPHSTRNADDDRAAEKALSEERRLMYVAMTRARKRLRISWCAERMLYGRTNSNSRSRFIDEIPEEHLHELNPVADKAPGSAWSGARYGSGSLGYGRSGYSSGGYGSGYGASNYGSGYGSRSTGGASGWQRPPSGEGARRLDSDGWRRAGVRPANEFAVRQTGSGLGSVKKKSEVPNAYGLSVGDMVEHKVFGRGRVEKILYPEKADQTKLFIKFASGTKELLAQFAAAGMHKID
ncbi:MAG: 3'-5' exonuclease, partial [Duodenibacillus sp.]